MPEAIRTRKCPICGAPVDRKTGPNRPFCSDRCKLIDLGAWATGKYAIPGKEIGRAQDPHEGRGTSDEEDEGDNIPR